MTKTEQAVVKGEKTKADVVRAAMRWARTSLCKCENCGHGREIIRACRAHAKAMKEKRK